LTATPPPPIEKTANVFIKIFKDELKGRVKNFIEFFLLIMVKNTLKLNIQTERMEFVFFSSC